jgi:hypothetical protein
MTSTTTPSNSADNGQRCSSTLTGEQKARLRNKQVAVTRDLEAIRDTYLASAKEFADKYGR